ncbi:MAG: TauD/TfdA family dioxygenase, partial [Nocardioides sp.]
QAVQQTGHSSEVVLDLHVEDAFHDLRCDNLTLLCLRNDQAATTVVDTGRLDLDSLDLEPLFEPRYLIRPDAEHLRNLREAGQRVPESIPISVLDGDRSAPYIRIDPPYMTAVDGDGRAARALDDLLELMGKAVIDVETSPGDLIMIDNQRALHGRRPFRARYDGTDRWLRRATTVRDLRRSRAHRDGVRSRVVRSC